MIVKIEPEVLKKLEEVFETFYLSGETKKGAKGNIIVKVTVKGSLKRGGEEINLYKEVPFDDQEAVDKDFTVWLNHYLENVCSSQEDDEPIKLEFGMGDSDEGAAVVPHPALTPRELTLEELINSWNDVEEGKRSNNIDQERMMARMFFRALEYMDSSQLYEFFSGINMEGKRAFIYLYGLTME
jgi:hypothetical protein